MSFLRAALAAVLPAAVLAVAASPAAADTIGPDYVASDNVEFVKTIPAPVVLTTGAKVLGKRLFVTSSKDLTIYDITTPDHPKQIGLLTADIQFENEEVPTNGEILGISSDTFNSGLDCAQKRASTLATATCLRLFDVRDPAGVRELPSVAAAGDHTSTCVLGCSYFYGSAGSIVDARGALDGVPATKLSTNWKTALASTGAKVGRCHHVRELRPGVLMTACQPFQVISVLAEHGGRIDRPVLLAQGENADGRFIHSARWPRAGTDRFALVGGETNFTGRCTGANARFMTFDASQAATTGRFEGPLDEIQPTNGTYTDGRPVAGALGCSVHWFQEHPTFRDGGLVALSEYENGVRFLQIEPDGEIVEQGFFQGLGGSASAPHWAPDGKTIYSIDYARGIDVLRYKGSRYVPAADTTVPAQPGAVAGTNGRQATALPAPTAAQRADVERARSQLQAQGWQVGYCLLVASRD